MSDQLEEQPIPEAAPTEDQFLDLQPCFRPVAKQYGRELFALVMNTGMTREATSVLAQLATKHHSKHGMHAVQVVANSYNSVANALCQAKGWNEGLLAQVERDIQLAFHSQIQVVDGSSPLILQH